MTTKPKAKKFRIRRNAAPEAQPPAAPSEEPSENLVHDIESRDAPEANRVRRRQQDPQEATEAPEPTEAPVPAALDIDEIRREGLTGRQLRMARRVAQKNGLAPTSDFDAVRLLREAGIDPFQRANMLQLVVPDDDSQENALTPADPQKPGSNLPRTMPMGGNRLTGDALSPAERRELEITKIKEDIARRRRRKLSMMAARLAFFVFLPTLLVGIYFYNYATPMYATKSQFLIIQSEGGGGVSPFGSILPTQFANSADSIATQAYLESKDAMLRLDQDTGFKAHFSTDAMDRLQRLPEGATNEEAYKIYKRNVKIGYDPTEGVIRMEVIAADPQVSAGFSRNLLEYAEERVNSLSQQKREDGMRDALQGFETAQQKRRDAQESLIRLQIQNGVDPEAEIASIRGQISTYEGLLIEKELELAALLDNARPNKAKVDGARGDVRRLEDQLDKLNARMNDATEGDNSLAERAVTMQLAQADLAAADMVLQSAQTTMEQARTEANRQVRYLTVAVQPVAPQEPTYPRKFENTILAFLVFAGIYLMMSLTASVLREQVAS